MQSERRSVSAEVTSSIEEKIRLYLLHWANVCPDTETGAVYLARQDIDFELDFALRDRFTDLPPCPEWDLEMAAFVKGYPEKYLTLQKETLGSFYLAPDSDQIFFLPDWSHAQTMLSQDSPLHTYLTQQNIAKPHNMSDLDLDQLPYENRERKIPLWSHYCALFPDAVRHPWSDLARNTNYLDFDFQGKGAGVSVDMSVENCCTPADISHFRYSEKWYNSLEKMLREKGIWYGLTDDSSTDLKEKIIKYLLDFARAKEGQLENEYPLSYQEIQKYFH